ncbi:MAG TPA: M48 family metalloprotease [Allosphingosinicella sp.]|uniref:M48 family metalloprotease n=1 Tax=Allosphingosinicella sp. TaxID=2823234 RepID=UPI002ED9169D
MFKRLLPAVFLSLALAAPAAASPALLALQQMDQRVATIGHRLARANLDLCAARTMPLSGLLLHSLDQYGAEARADAAAAFGLGEAPVVLAVVPDSAAARAGLQPGDALLSVAGKSFPLGKLSRKGSYKRVQALEEHLLSSLGAGPVTVEYARGSVRGAATLAPEQGCLSRVQLVPGAKLNARADGTYVQVTSRLVDFVKSDDELALVVAHEMAHNILSHRTRLDAQKVSRGILKTFDGSAGKIKATEVEADYLALYLMARAGYDVNAAPGFWKRFGPGGIFEIFADGTHPGKGSRIEAAERTIAEIRLKQQQGLPLMPAFTGS